MTGFEIAILFVIVYWLFGPRVMAMVDVLSTHVQAIYNYNAHAYAKPDLTMLPSVKRQVALKRKQREQGIPQGRDINLSSVKTNPWSGFPSKPRNLLKSPCTSCEANVLTRAAEDNPNDDDVVDILDVKEASSPNPFVRMFSDLVHMYNIPNHPFVKIQDTVVTDERVQDAIAETVSAVLSEADGEVTENAYSILLAKYTRRARLVVKQMHAAISIVMLKITSFLMYKLLPGSVTSVCVHPGQIEMVKRTAQARVPIVYVPLHRSHLDYILIIFTLLNSNIKPPLTAAGINLNIPVFGALLRWLGAFYIKRRIDPAAGGKDLIYRAALHSYMVQCLKAGHDIKFYIEGGRTRTGKPLLPKVGLLSVIVDAYMDGAVEDVHLVPVSVNYDKLVDGNFVRECLGQPKEKETFTFAIKSIWRTLSSSHGSCAINFNHPYSLMELVKSFQSETVRVTMPSGESQLPKTGSFSSLHGTDVVREDYRCIVEHIANHIVYDCAEASAVMSTNVVAWLLLTRCRAGVKLGVLVHLLDELRSDLSAQRRHLGFSGDSVDIINSAVSLLGPGLVKRVREPNQSEWEELIIPVTYLPNVIELAYYSNALLPQYILHSIIATTVFTLMKNDLDGKVRNVTLHESKIIEHSKTLCEILKLEFLFHRPCQDLETVLSQALLDLSTKGLLPRLRINKRKDDYGFEDDDDENGPSVIYRVSPAEEDLANLQQLSVALRPLLDSYVVTVLTLERLVGRQMTEGDFVKEVLEEIQSHLNTGFCLYAESCSVDPIKNAVKLLKQWGVLESFTKDSIRLLYLSQEHDSVERLNSVFYLFTQYKYTVPL